MSEQTEFLYFKDLQPKQRLKEFNAKSQRGRESHFKQRGQSPFASFLAFLSAIALIL